MVGWIFKSILLNDFSKNVSEFIFIFFLRNPQKTSFGNCPSFLKTITLNWFWIYLFLHWKANHYDLQVKNKFKLPQGQAMHDSYLLVVGYLLYSFFYKSKASAMLKLTRLLRQACFTVCDVYPLFSISTMHLIWLVEW